MNRLIAPLVLGAALLLSACSSSDPANPTNPTALSTGSSMSITARAIGPMPSTPSVVCSTASPFLVPFMVSVAPVGSVTLVVTGISAQFIDSRGIAAQQVTLPAPVPTVQYGTALDQARNAQNFPVNVCRALDPGKITVVVNAHDMVGRKTNGTVTVPVE